MSPKEIMLLVLLVFIYFIKVSSDDNINDDFECDSSCRSATENWFGSFINSSVDPCEDFYSFMCSKWKAKYIIPGFYDGVWNYNFYKKYNQEMAVMKVLEEYGNNRFNLDIHDKLFSYYYSCMYYGQYSYINIPEGKLKKLLENIGGFPILGIALKDHYNWEEAIALLIRELDFSEVFVKLSVKKNLKNHTTNIITLEKGRLGDEIENLLACEEYAEDINDICNNYRKNMEDSLIQIESRTTNVFHREFMNRTLDFEKNLTEIVNINAKWRERPADYSHKKKKNKDDLASYNLMTVQQLQNLMGDKANIKRLLEKVFEDIIDIDNDTEIAVTDPTYMKNLANLLANTDTETIANYIGWRVIKEFAEAANMLHPNDPTNPYNHVKIQNIKINCANSISRSFYYALAYFYSKTFDIDEDTYEEIKRMYANLKTAFRSLIENSTWMDNSSRRESINKLNGMKLLTVGPSKWFSKEFLDDQYYIEIPRTEYFENYIYLRHRTAYKKLESVIHTPDYEVPWSKYLTQFVPSYDVKWNNLYLPIGAIKYPLYGRRYPAWMKFGHIGTLMAREISHALDRKGIRFDRFGELQELWTSETRKQLNIRRRCFKRQYANYRDPITGIRLNSFMTLHENLADNVGLKVSYMAYKHFVENCDKKCDGELSLNYTSDQLFFMTYGLTMCGYHRPEDTYKYYQRSRYSPAIYRILGTLSNSRPFLQAFNCSTTSKLHRSKICSVW